MMQFRCEQCGKAIKVSGTLAGNFVPCPWCKALVQAPMPVDDDGDGPEAAGPPYESQRGSLLKQPPAIFLLALLLYALLALGVWYVLFNPDVVTFSGPPTVEDLPPLDPAEPESDPVIELD